MNQKTINQDLLQTLDSLRDLGVNCLDNKCILDLGCGNGEKVLDMINLGIDAYGCDLDVGPTLMKNTLLPVGTSEADDDNRLKLIILSPYHLPFADNFFDVIISFQVFEHVQDYESTLSEIRRILKPDGCCLHIFPSRYELIEGHLLIPFGGAIQNRYWIALWAKLGIRNRYQKDMNAEQVTKFNQDFLANFTNYLTSKAIENAFRKHFNDFAYSEKTVLKNAKSSKAKFLFNIMKLIPFSFRLYRVFRTRAVFVANPIK